MPDRAADRPHSGAAPRRASCSPSSSARASTASRSTATARRRHDDGARDDHDDHDATTSTTRPSAASRPRRSRRRPARTPATPTTSPTPRAPPASSRADLNDGLGQAGHVDAGRPSGRATGPGSCRPAWSGIMWVLSMIVFVDVIFGGNEYEVTVYEWIASGDFHVEISFLVDALTAMLLLVVSTVGLPRPRLLDRLHGRRPRASGASSPT